MDRKKLPLSLKKLWALLMCPARQYSFTYMLYALQCINCAGEEARFDLLACIYVCICWHVDSRGALQPCRQLAARAASLESSLGRGLSNRKDNRLHAVYTHACMCTSMHAIGENVNVAIVLDQAMNC